MEASSSKKRKSNELDGLSSPRASKTTKMETMDPAQLLSMNKALVVEMHEKRLKIKRIIQKCEQLYKSRSAAESSYRCIRRHWQQMIADFKILTANITVSDESVVENIVNATDVYGNIDVNRDLQLHMPDWYALGDDSEDENEQPELPQVDEALKQECETAKSILNPLVASLVNARATLTDAKSIAEANEKLTAEIRTVSIKTMALTDQVTTLKRHIAEMEKDAQVSEKERHRAVRDLERYKHNTDGHGGVERTAKVEQQTTASSSSEPVKKVKSEEVKIDEGKIQELELKCQTLESKLRQEQEKNNDTTLVDAERREAQRIHEELRAEIARLQNIAEQSRRDAQTFMDERDVALKQGVETVQRHNEEWSQRLEKTQEEVGEANAKVNELEIELNRVTADIKAQDIDEKHIEDLESLTKEMKLQISTLKKDCFRAEERGKKSQKQKTQTHLEGLATKVKNLESENAGLQKSIASLKKSMLESADVQLKNALEEKVQAEKHVLEVKSRVQRREATIDKLTHEMNELKKEKDSSEEIEGLISEIESISKEFDTTIGRNAQLVEMNKKLALKKHKLTEKNMQLSTSKTLLAEEMSGLRLKLSDAQEIIKKTSEVKEAAEETCQATKAELEQLQNHGRQLWTEVEQSRQAVRRIKNEVEVAKSKLEHEFKTRACAGCKKWEEQEAGRVEKLKQARAAGTDPMTAVEKYELTGLRKLVKCSVCLDGQKNVIITKCFHMFCKDCIDSNLKARNRKCPTCKKMYGSDDVKSVWVD